jgi:N-dimethylarginine dimethylaminohydrolase
MVDPPSTCQSDVGHVTRVVLKHARSAYVDATSIARQWRGLGYLQAPRFDEAGDESDAFAALLEGLGAEVIWMPPDDDVGLDSLYVRDASVVCDRGAILCNMGKHARRAEPEAAGRLYAELGIPVLGAIEGDGRLEGGDLVWLSPRVAAVGQGYRTNAEGIAQLRALLADAVDELIVVPLPHWRGPGDVFHLMSMISPLDEDLAVVYEPLLSVPFRQGLIDRGFTLIGVPDEELDLLGCNVLAVAPRVAVAVEGCPRTRLLMEQAGVRVHTYAGREISAKGCGGPTCLTRPLARTVTGRRD